MKSIVLKPIDADNILRAFALELTEEQRIFVSHPMRSLALGYAYRNQCQPFGIYDGDEMVGYVMVIYDHDEAVYNLWHFMIDRSLQGRGYGRAALRAALDFIRTRPLGDADRVLLTCHPENGAALKIYFDAGFQKTGRMDGEEIELGLTL